MHFAGTGAGDDLSIEHDGYTREHAARAYLEGIFQISCGVGVRIFQRELGAGKDHGSVQIREHGKKGGGSIRHSVCTMAEDEAVHAGEVLVYTPGHLLPVERLDVGTVQTGQLFCFYRTDVPDPRYPFQKILGIETGRQAAGSGFGGDGAPCGQK